MCSFVRELTRVEGQQRDVRELERAHSQEPMPSSRSFPGAGSAGEAGHGHTATPAAAAKRTPITFSRLLSKTQLAARRLRRW